MIEKIIQKKELFLNVENRKSIDCHFAYRDYYVRAVTNKGTIIWFNRKMMGIENPCWIEELEEFYQASNTTNKSHFKTGGFVTDNSFSEQNEQHVRRPGEVFMTLKMVKKLMKKMNKL